VHERARVLVVEGEVEVTALNGTAISASAGERPERAILIA
jgi:ABC-type phosphate/phosphonate transport system substrate-binding protein